MRRFSICSRSVPCRIGVLAAALNGKIEPLEAKIVVAVRGRMFGGIPRRYFLHSFPARRSPVPRNSGPELKVSLRIHHRRVAGEILSFETEAVSPFPGGRVPKEGVVQESESCSSDLASFDYFEITLTPAYALWIDVPLDLESRCEIGLRRHSASSRSAPAWKTREGKTPI